MKVSDVLKGKITLEVMDYGINCESHIEGTVLGRAMLFDAFCKSLKMYNPMDQLSMIAIITEGGLEGVLKDKCEITTVNMTKLEEMMKGEHGGETEI